MINTIRFFILFFAFTSCKSEQVADEISDTCSDYIAFVKKQDYKKNKANEILISVYKEEIRTKKITAYRIAAQPRLIPFGLIPNNLRKINGYDVLFFSGIKDSYEQKMNLENRLKKMKIYSEEAYRINSNYPEWVLIVNSKTKTKHYLVKDAWYKPLDSLIVKRGDY